MDERALRTLVDAAAIRRTRIVGRGEAFHVEVDSPGRSFTIETAKGGLRTWRSLDAVAKWLRSVGIAEAQVNVAQWAPGQKGLPL